MEQSNDDERIILRKLWNTPSEFEPVVTEGSAASDNNAVPQQPEVQTQAQEPQTDTQAQQPAGTATGSTGLMSQVQPQQVADQHRLMYSRHRLQARCMSQPQNGAMGNSAKKPFKLS